MSQPNLFKNKINRPHLKWLVALCLILLFVAVVYLKTILPGMGYSGDTAKFQFIGKVLGVPHPPGYPLYVLLNRLFITIPISSIAFRANLMSLFFGLLTLSFLFFILRNIGVSLYLAAGTILYFAFTYTFWTQNLVAEVYTLNSLLLTLIIYFLLKWQLTGKRGFLWSAVMFFGLGLAHHLTVVLLAPAFIFLLVKSRPKEFLSLRFWLLGVSSLAIGIIPYSFLFIRTYQRAAYLESPVRNFSDFFIVLTAKYFQPDLFVFGWKELITKRIPWFFQQLEKEWSWPVLLLIFMGIIWLSRSNPSFSFFLFLFILGQAIFIINYHIHDIVVFFIPVYLGLTIFLGMGWEYLALKLSSLFRKASKLHFKHLSFYLIFIICLGSSLLLIVNNFSRANFKKMTFYDGQLNALFDSLDPKEAVVVLTDNYLETQFFFHKLLLDYPEHLVFHFTLEPDEAVLPQIKRRLDHEILTNPRLQSCLFGNNNRRKPEDLLQQFWSKKMRPKREQFFSRVYFNSTCLRLRLFKEGIKTVKLVGKEKKKGKTYYFYRATLPPDF